MVGSVWAGADTRAVSRSSVLVPIGFHQWSARFGRDVVFLVGIGMGRIKPWRVSRQILRERQLCLPDSLHDALGELIAAVVVVMRLVVIGECPWQRLLAD